ncbi:MAG: 4-oxalocrotonate tautomerase family protein [Dehalococcoidia bacterium]|nr:4-oxalocrotonate tautomerase family protein [Dehalococcoidia bacterium]
MRAEADCHVRRGILEQREVSFMPIVKIEWFAGRSTEQKARVAKALTDVLVEIGGAPRDQTYIIFHEEPKENWAIGGKLASER